MFAQPSTATRPQRSSTDTQPLWGLAPGVQTATAPAAAVIDTAAHTVPQSASPALAWSAEEPDDISDPLDWARDQNAAESARVLPWYLRPGLLLAAAVAVVAIAAAGLILSLHGGGPTIAVPAVKPNSTAPSAAGQTVATPTTSAEAPPPTASPTVVVDQASDVPRAPQTSIPQVSAPTQIVTPSALPAPQPAPPTWTPKPVEHWPPYGSSRQPPIWGSHRTTGKSGKGHDDAGSGTIANGGDHDHHGK